MSTLFHGTRIQRYILGSTWINSEVIHGSSKTTLKDSREGFGILPSWPANAFFLQTTLDHAMVSENVQVITRQVGEYIGSDHLPIYLEIGIP